MNNWQEKIASLANQSEQLGTLHPDVLAIAYQYQWFKLYVPEVYGGPGKKLPEILRLLEDIAYVDGSTAWTVTLCSGAGWFAGFLDQSLATDILADEKVCFAGSGAVGGTATQTEDGYQVNGCWQYASGALHATIFTANCVLKDAFGKDILDDDGNVVIKSFILKKEEVDILPGWAYFGLVATGSHAFEVRGLKVATNRSFVISKQVAVLDEGFDYPFMQMAETTLTVNTLGMARKFVDLVSDSFYKRSGLRRYSETQIAHFDEELALAKSEIESYKSLFYKTFQTSWKQLLENKEISEDLLKQVSSISRRTAHKCRQLVDGLYPYAGLEAAKKETELNRVWRDIHTASQHALLTFKS